jgi:hypothetical protein
MNQQSMAAMSPATWCFSLRCVTRTWRLSKRGVARRIVRCDHRVLRPGGYMVILDLAYASRYAEVLCGIGMIIQGLALFSLASALPFALCTETKKCVRPLHSHAYIMSCPSEHAAITTISTRYSGAASFASTVARAGL